MLFLEIAAQVISTPLASSINSTTLVRTLLVLSIQALLRTVQVLAFTQNLTAPPVCGPTSEEGMGQQGLFQVQALLG